MRFVRTDSVVVLLWLLQLLDCSPVLRFVCAIVFGLARTMAAFHFNARGRRRERRKDGPQIEMGGKKKIPNGTQRRSFLHTLNCFYNCCNALSYLRPSSLKCHSSVFNYIKEAGIEF